MSVLKSPGDGTRHILPLAPSGSAGRAVCQDLPAVGQGGDPYKSGCIR